MSNTHNSVTSPVFNVGDIVELTKAHPALNLNAGTRGRILKIAVKPHPMALVLFDSTNQYWILNDTLHLNTIHLNTIKTSLGSVINVQMHPSVFYTSTAVTFGDLRIGATFLIGDGDFWNIKISSDTVIWGSVNDWGSVKDDNFIPTTVRFDAETPVSDYFVEDVITTDGPTGYTFEMTSTVEDSECRCVSILNGHDNACAYVASKGKQ